MERLTKSGTISGKDINELLDESNENQMCKTKAYYKLQEYEDLEEQDRLIKLPCKVGDSIYSVIEDGLTIIELKFSLDFYVRRKNDIGKTVFLTQAEAEQKLKEMESSHDRE